ncbi:hypothetical protein GJAV_G00211420 [Gymnothorax javanicus]|nr:hypothetical protein GJAV_G00211420 [Gymnothorax javanicus]
MEAQVMDEESVEAKDQETLDHENTVNANPQDTQATMADCATTQAPVGSFPTEVKIESQELSVTVPIPENSVLAENITSTNSQNKTEEFVIFDQNGQPIQYERMVIVAGQSEEGQLFVIPSNHFGGTQVLLPRGQLMDMSETAGPCLEKASTEHAHTITLTAITEPSGGSAALSSPPVTQSKALPQSSPDSFAVPLKPLPPNTPSWAHLLHDCEKIGDSYRGFCSTEAELEAVLMLHKQHTHSVFGTRQSPSPAKPATRLMWKSQYVPYDGIPFVNAGSRAIVMECQFGPRRKGLQPKRTVEQESSSSASYKATCPARIYIKKVRKFPEYRVPTDPQVDKKVVRQEQEKAFFNLRKNLWDAGGVLRYYVQLPTLKAHLYHSVDAPVLSSLPAQLLLAKEEEQEEEEEVEEEGAEGGVTADEGSFVPSRLHPRVAEKIVELVAQGFSQVYSVRKQLRKFVEREMFKWDKVPARHNLCYFPTVNDIKNHIHEAQKKLQAEGSKIESDPTCTQWTAASESPLSETVTLTLTPTATEVPSDRGEVLEGSDTLSPEALQLFSSLTALQPKIFAQLQGVQIQPTPAHDLALPLNASSHAFTAPQPLLLSPAHFLQPAVTPLLGEGVSLSDSTSLLGVAQLVSVSTIGDTIEEGGGVTQILLDDGQAIPVQIVEPVSAEVSLPEDQSPAIKTEDSDINPLESP